MSKFYRNKGLFTSWLKGNGLYLTLGATGLAVLCIGGLLFSPQPEETVNAPVVSDSVQTDTGASDLSSDAGTSSVSDSSDGGDETTDSSESAAPAEDVGMIFPVSGTVGTDFSLTVPVFSATMEDWRVHQGIDFKTEEETDVVAVADGIVENVYVSELMGHTVEVRHADGTISVYQSLSEEPSVLAGQEVRQGDVIGMTGLSADSECMEGIHLHFALIREGVYLDPNDRLD